MLYIVPTPIGNLQDITLRSLEVLKTADYIVCEDTRQTKKLLTHYGIMTKTLRYNENDENSIKGLLALLKENKTLALVSDAGTPCVSDPGWKLVRASRENNIKVSALAGASALTCALSGAGVSGGGFCFLGFMPRKKGKIIKQLTSAFALEKPVIVYESPYRIIKFLELVKESFKQDIYVVIAREITKTFEEYLADSLPKIIETLKSRKKIWGEFAIILDARPKDKQEDDDDADENF